jgi:hypothetical protein
MGVKISARGVVAHLARVIVPFKDSFPPPLRPSPISIRYFIAIRIPIMVVFTQYAATTGLYPATPQIMAGCHVMPTTITMTLPVNRTASSSVQGYNYQFAEALSGKVDHGIGRTATARLGMVIF